MKEKGKEGETEKEEHSNEILISRRKGDMAKLVDATDLIRLSLGMETY